MPGGGGIGGRDGFENPVMEKGIRKGERRKGSVVGRQIICENNKIEKKKKKDLKKNKAILL